MKAFTKWWRREREDEAMQFKCGSSDAFEYWAASEEEEVSFTYLSWKFVHYTSKVGGSGQGGPVALGTPQSGPGLRDTETTSLHHPRTPEDQHTGSRHVGDV